MRKQAFCRCENKDADQPRAILCGCTVRFVSDQVRNPEDRVSSNEAQIMLLHVTLCTMWRLGMAYFIYICKSFLK